MGLLDQLAGQVMGSLSGQQDQPGSTSGAMGAVMALVERAGGVPALLEQLRASGLGDQVASWIGTGANHAISGEQLSSAVGDGALAQVARQSGIEPSALSGALAGLLPQVIDHLSPNGNMPSEDLLSQGLNMLKGKLFN
ncbi:Uncharacterized conserved protein YidB, DUF937 family [Massilia sp. CF038]|nr:Uncharacterized conserved protein YidB, DUF937 family [Massilia sp. CF038]